MEGKLKVHSTFTTVSGEVGFIVQGHPVNILRLQGCNLDCHYCDTPDSILMKKGTEMTPTEIYNSFKCDSYPLMITGGEPLIQTKEIVRLLDSQAWKHSVIQIETNGTINIEPVQHKNVCVVMDYKFHMPPTLHNIQRLRKRDWLKFVCTTSDEVKQAMYLARSYEGSNIAISATNMQMYKAIVEKLIKLKLRIVVNVQLHKTINVE